MYSHCLTTPRPIYVATLFTSHISTNPWNMQRYCTTQTSLIHIKNFTQAKHTDAQTYSPIASYVCRKGLVLVLVLVLVDLPFHKICLLRLASAVSGWGIDVDPIFALVNTSWLWKISRWISANRKQRCILIELWFVITGLCHDLRMCRIFACSVDFLNFPPYWI